MEAIDLYGRDWKKVQQHVGTRSSTQSRSHAQKYFKKMGIENVSSELSKLKHKDSNASGFSIAFPKASQGDEKGDSDSDSDLIM